MPRITSLFMIWEPTTRSPSHGTWGMKVKLCQVPPGKPGSCSCMHLSRSLLLPATTLHSAANASIWGVSSHTHSMTLLYLSQLPVPLSSLRWPQAKVHGSLLYLQTQQRDTMNYSCYDNSRTNTIVWKTNSILPIPCKQLKCSSQRLGNSAVGSCTCWGPLLRFQALRK